MNNSSTNGNVQKFKFADVVQHVADRVMPTPSDSTMYIGLEHMNSNYIEVEEWGTDVEMIGTKLKMKKGDVLLARRNPYLRRVQRSPHDGIFSAHGMVLRSKSENLIQEFLLRYMQSSFFWGELDRIAVGSLSKTINWGDLAKLDIFLPSLEEQLRIVKFLDAISHHEKLIRETIVKTLETKSSFISEFLLINSKNSKKVSISEISQLAYGVTQSASKIVVGPKFLRITDIQEDSVNWDTVPYCKIEDSEFERQKLIDGDIVFARTGATTGKSFLIQDPPVAVCASYLIRLRPSLELVRPQFLYLFFSSEDYWIQVRSGTSGSAQGGVNSSKLGRMTLELPSIEIQDQLVTSAEIFDETISSLQESLVEIRSFEKMVQNFLFNSVKEG